MYIGRFAPSPTGPLHFGSLVAAVASHLEARKNKGRWLVRMENLDKPREMAGAADGILSTLEAFGFEWDGAVLYQSNRQHAYAETLDLLAKADKLYACTCSRKEIADSAQHGIDGLVYPGTCRNGIAGEKTARAWRLRTENRRISVEDLIQGRIEHDISRDIGDFVLKRADGQFSYQLAVVRDDANQGITHIVRGADLLDSTPRQVYLQQLLGYPLPSYAHVPVVTNSQGEKLSKQTLAQALGSGEEQHELHRALAFLGQKPPGELRHHSLSDVWRWAHAHWQLASVPKQRNLQEAD